MKDLHCLRSLYAERSVNSCISSLTLQRLFSTFKVSAIIFKFSERSTLQIDIIIKVATNSLNLQMTSGYRLRRKQIPAIRFEFIQRHSKERNATKDVSLLFLLFSRRTKQWRMRSWLETWSSSMSVEIGDRISMKVSTLEFKGNISLLNRKIRIIFMMLHSLIANYFPKKKQVKYPKEKSKKMIWSTTESTFHLRRLKKNLLSVSLPSMMVILICS